MLVIVQEPVGRDASAAHPGPRQGRHPPRGDHQERPQPRSATRRLLLARQHSQPGVHTGGGRRHLLIHHLHRSHQLDHSSRHTSLPRHDCSSAVHHLRLFTALLCLPYR